MVRKIFNSQWYYQVCCLVLFALVAAASFNEFYGRTRFNEVNSPAFWYQSTFEGMVDGTAYRPYVYRQLLPDLANWFNAVVPESVQVQLYDWQMNPSRQYPSAMTASLAARNHVYFFRYLVVYFGTYLSALIAVWAMYLVCRAVDLPPPAAVLASIIVILLLPYAMSGGGYFYDYPELAFLALAVWFALRFKWWWMVPVVLLGTWNKESFLLFIPALYPLFRRRSSAINSMLGIGVLGLVSAAVYYWLRLRFAHNPGSTVIFWLPDEMQLILHPKYLLLATREAYGIPMIMGYTLGPMLLLVWTVWRAWRHLPKAIQRHAQIAAVINVPLYLLFVQPGKLRDLSMLYITFLLVLAVNLSQWITDSKRPETLYEGGYSGSPIGAERSLDP